jgi:hypothetical protein
MSACDLFHQVVKNALQKENWQITHDPYGLHPIYLITYDIEQEKLVKWIPSPN